MATGTIIINDDLRTMQIPSSITLLGVESDDDVNVLQFQMPKEYNGFDLSEFQARINYMNAHGDGDTYIATDLAVDDNDPSLMNFSWLVGRNACAYMGNVQFIVCLKKFDEEDDVIQEFNTTVYTLPVLRGLETTEAIEQQNADIIEHILQMIEDAGSIDLSNYYTKTQVNALIPTQLPNPQAITINGTSYDGSEPVEMTIEATSEVLATASGQIIHVVDAVPQAVENLTAYDSGDQPIASAVIAVANKNLFRIDLLASTITDKGLTFTKDADGGIIVSGTSTGAYPMTSCTLDPCMFAVGNTYTLSSGKTTGYSYVQLIINYADSSTDYIVARNSARSFTISKAVSSVTGSVQITDSGVTVSNEVVYPQLELSDSASSFVMNAYSSMTYDGTIMPVLPAAVSNIWSPDPDVDSLTMEYEADSNITKVDKYVTDNLKHTNGSMIAVSDNQHKVCYLQAVKPSNSAYNGANVDHRIALSEDVSDKVITINDVSYTVFNMNQDGNIVINMAGTYEISAALEVGNSGKATVTIAVKDGDDFDEANSIVTVKQDVAASTRQMITTGSKMVQLAAGDVLYFSVNVTSGTPSCYANGMTYVLVKAIALTA